MEQAAKMYPSRQHGAELAQTELISNDDPRAAQNNELAQTNISVSGEEIKQGVEPNAELRESNI